MHTQGMWKYEGTFWPVTAIRDATGISCLGTTRDTKCSVTRLSSVHGTDPLGGVLKEEIVLPRRTTASLLRNTGSLISNLLDALGVIEPV